MYMKTNLLIPILAVLTIALLSGCTTNVNNYTSPLIGVWETKVIGFTQTLRFENNGTGVLVTTLGQLAFAFQIVDGDTLLVKTENSNDWDEKEYNLVSNNTLQYGGLTWVRQGTV